MTKTKHVLQICHGYSGPFLDCARQYAQLFHHTQYEVTTVFITGNPSEHVVNGCGSQQVIFLNKSSKDIRGLKLGAVKQIKKITASKDFCLCIAHRYKSMYVACLGSNLPDIAIFHAFGDFQHRTRRLFATLFRKRLSILGVSNAVRDDIRQCLSTWAHDRIETLYNRIDVNHVTNEQLTRADSRKKLNLDCDAWIIGNVGRLHPDKDQETLIKGFAKALPQLPQNSALVIIGTGKLKPHLTTLIQTLKLTDNVFLLGQVPNARRYFKAFNLFALSSDHEPFGMVLLEAMAANIPIISTSCGGAAEVIGNSGTLFPLADTEILAQNLIRLSTLSTEQIATMRDKMHTRLTEYFSDEAVTAKFWQLNMTQPYLKNREL
jgi:glycosyltransferase involved in cell wall biosynthesis